MIKAIVLALGLLAGHVTAENYTLEADHLDLELEIQGRRELFPLLPGTKCPTGHKCRARNMHHGMSPLMSSLKNNFDLKLLDAPEKQALNFNLNSAVESGDYCTRRAAMARAAGLAAGLAVSAVHAPAYAAETKNVGMGTESGQLVFEPSKLKICKGDSVTWTIVKAGPHNVVFDADAVPAGVNTEAISMDEQLGEEGETFTRKFDIAGAYSYYCEPHRSAGMQATLMVE